MKLSDFQPPSDAPTLHRNLAAEALVAANAARIRAGAGNYRNTTVTLGEAYREGELGRLEKAFDAHDRRTRIHAAVDRLIDGAEEEAEEEVEDDETPESLDSAVDTLHRRLRAILHASDSVKSPRRSKVDRGAARVVSSRREVTAKAGYVTDVAFIAQHLDPNQLCVEAENALHDISLQRQADDANRGYWSGLFYFLKSQPKGTRIRDIENQRCLSTLLQHTVGGMRGVFGA